MTQLAIGDRDLGLARIDEPQSRINAPACHRRQLEVREVLPPRRTEQPLHRWMDTLLASSAWIWQRSRELMRTSDARARTRRRR